MTELPRGTVSLLFTDIEGSTQLQRRLGVEYQAVVELHRRLLEEAIAANGGTVVDRQTESFFAVFASARDAVGAAVQAQQSLASHAWPKGGGPKVRMGLHAGEPELAGDRYVGLAVSRAARICAAGHGGQVLVSSSARSLLADDDRVVLRPLGSYRLKDFAGPEAISQVTIEGLPWKFPPLRAQRAAPRRMKLLTVGVAVVAGAIAAAAVVVLTGGGSSGLKAIGPTSVGVIDPTSGKLVDEIDVGFKPSLIAAGEGSVWVADPNGSTLVKIDPRTRKIVNRTGIAVGAGAVPFGLAAGEGAVWLAVLKGDKQFVLKLGPELGEPQGQIQFGETGTGFSAFRLQPLAVGEHAVWAIDATVGGLWRIDPRTERAKQRGEDGLDALSLAVGGGAVWIAGSSTVTKRDATTGQPLGENRLGSGPVAETSSIALGKGAVWFTASSEAKLWEIDESTNTTTQTFAVGRGPSGVAAGEGAVWVANSRDGTVSRVDPGGGEPTTIKLGSSPGGIVAAYGSVWTSPGEPRG